MIRIIVENVLLFLLPTLLYVGYVVVSRAQASGEAGEEAHAAGVLDDAPLLWLFGAGALLVIVTLVAFGSTTGGKPGQHYEPPSLEDGTIKPGHIE